MTDLERTPILAALYDQWDVLTTLLADVGPADRWHTATPLPGWTVHDVTAHLIGTESMLEGLEPPTVHVDVAALPHVHNPIGARNELWVEGLRALPGDDMVARFRDITARRRASLDAMSDDALAEIVDTPAGRAPYLRFMRIRLFDCWIHELDLRDALGAPTDESGPRAELAFGEITTSLGYVVGKKAGAPDGATVTFALTGPMARSLHVAVGTQGVPSGRGAVVDALDAPATATIELDSRLFTRLACGRTRAEDHPGEVTVSGDDALGRRAVDHLAFTI
ncbi:maleylpyruvate isomerase family mycothiol-dependent enzyme [Rhodococcus sp. HNM0569]|uniref:maleylpyruvate isomerase family mycothiol-dependent enzyme n=1 Tax=Rhodococcus sp. HNM0569 TaxID=2716340 RepID=UPI0014699E91|nr:maleylpyruvate isomerase family mycothiol-dependent enzyme [Rhodococcus sp. HNM0569]NLU84412.1 maleylpyruvate isomerase family mycothiol-dependent enzyme [Rhodococcus sp. HNM0569]